jgi:hypothetical protein
MGFAVGNCDSPGRRAGSPEQRRSAPSADSLQTLLADLAALARHTVTTTAAMSPAQEFVVHWNPTELQQEALEPPINHTTCTEMLNRITRSLIEMGEAQSREAQSSFYSFFVEASDERLVWPMSYKSS